VTDVGIEKNNVIAMYFVDSSHQLKKAIEDIKISMLKRISERERE
jgi:hypothetical protein